MKTVNMAAVFIKDHSTNKLNYRQNQYIAKLFQNLQKI